MDWSAVVTSLVERTGVSALLLGSRAELLFISPAAERALDLRANDLGSDWLEHHIARSDGASARWKFERALEGALRVLELPVRTQQGTAMARFEACPVDGTRSGVLLVLEHLIPLARAEQLSDYDYEVDDVRSGSPRLRRVYRLGAESRTAQGHCFEVLHGRSSPCEACPAAKDAGARLMVSLRRSRDYVLTHANIDGDVAHLSVRTVSRPSLAALMTARLDELAARARLSKRERAVFGQLMEGRSLEEIALALEITPRTVKFHQANVLQKLGADSRIDLMRLVL